MRMWTSNSELRVLQLLFAADAPCLALEMHGAAVSDQVTDEALAVEDAVLEFATPIGQDDADTGH